MTLEQMKRAGSQSMSVRAWKLFASPKRFLAMLELLEEARSFLLTAPRTDWDCWLDKLKALEEMA